jgi:hypothetical protein
VFSFGFLLAPFAAREFPSRSSQRKSNQGIYNNFKYVDVNFTLPCTDNTEGPVDNERNLTLGFL